MTSVVDIGCSNVQVTKEEILSAEASRISHKFNVVTS